MKNLLLTFCFVAMASISTIAQTFNFNKIGRDTQNMQYSETTVTFTPGYIYIQSDLVEGVMQEKIKYIGSEQGSEVYQDQKGVYYFLNKKTYMFCIVYGPGEMYFFCKIEYFFSISSNLF